MGCASKIGVLGLLVACGQTSSSVELEGTTMGTTYMVKCVGRELRAASPVALHELVERELAAIDRVFSTWRTDSEIARFNAFASTEPFAASSDFVTVVRAALEVATKTDGAFDPTVMPLVRAYGFGAGGDKHQASDAAILAARTRVGYDKLVVLDDGHVAKRIPDLELDLDGIAPGFAVDRLVERLLAQGVAGCMVEIGGEVRCAGEKAPAVPWAIGIEGPDSRDPTLAKLAEVVELRDQALATSGSYRNQVREQGAVVHHIFDPRTGRNATHGVVSVSVLAPTCMLADALATAFMVRGAERAEEVLDRFAVEAPRILLQKQGSGGVDLVRVRW